MKDTDGNYLLDKAIGLFASIVQNESGKTLRAQAEQLNIPLSTAYRLMTSFARAGLVTSAGRGKYGPGLELVHLAEAIDRHKVIADAARSPLRRLARERRQTVHLGVLENDMVTYLVKERGGGPPIFTQAGMQLEAYCSAIGKMLLANLPTAECERYISGEPFIALTAKTITDASLLRATLDVIRETDSAIDDQEVSDDLRCIAVPIRDRHRRVVAAISLSRLVVNGMDDDRMVLAALQVCARRIEAII